MFDQSLIKEVHFHIGPISIDLRTKEQRISFLLWSIGIGFGLIALVNTPIGINYFPKLLNDLLMSIGTIFFLVGLILYALTRNDNESKTKETNAIKIYKSVLYNLQHLDAFSKGDLERILVTTEHLVIENTYLFSEEWTATWRELKLSLLQPTALTLRKKLVDEIQEKLKRLE